MPTWMTVGLVVCWLAIMVVLLFNAIDPRSMWEMSAWQYQNPAAHEPSEAAYRFTRIGSIVCLVALLGGGIAFFVHLATASQ
jgi:hypothetical protein